MPSQKKASKPVAHRPSSPINLHSPTSTPPSGSEGNAFIAALERELKKSACSPKMRQWLETSSDSFDAHAKLLLARAVIKFGIRELELAWVNRALESSDPKRIAITILIDDGVHETLPVARAILDEIIAWDKDESESLPLRVRDLSDLLTRLFQNTPSQKTEVLDQVARDDQSLQVAVDTILGKDTPEANATRKRWFPEEVDPEAEVSSTSSILQSEYDNSIIQQLYHDLPLEVEEHHYGPPLLEDVDKEKEAKEQRLLEDLLATVPKDASYQDQVIAAQAITHAVRQALAMKLAPALNAKLRRMPHATVEEKKELAQWINAQIEPLGLAVQCPNTGLPSKLRGISGNLKPDGSGSFCYQIYRDGKTEKSAYSDTLPELTLIDAGSNVPEASWQKAVGPKGTREGRKRS